MAAMLSVTTDNSEIGVTGNSDIDSTRDEGNCIRNINPLHFHRYTNKRKNALYISFGVVAILLVLGRKTHRSGLHHAGRN